MEINHIVPTSWYINVSTLKTQNTKPVKHRIEKPEYRKVEEILKSYDKNGKLKKKKQARILKIC